MEDRGERENKSIALHTCEVLFVVIEHCVALLGDNARHAARLLAKKMRKIRPPRPLLPSNMLATASLLCCRQDTQTQAQDYNDGCAGTGTKTKPRARS